MVSTTNPTATLCHCVCSTRYGDLPAEVRRETVTLLYDQVGCMIASATLPSCQPVVELVRRLSPPGACSIVGHPVRTSVTQAALANGTIGHGDEVDSTGQHGTGHYAATTVPTALSAGQYVGASGQEFIRALALSSEVTARLQSILGHYGTRGQFAASVGGALGAAVGAGLLLGLDAEQMENALGLAASGACGLSSHHLEPLHQIKSLNHGRAAEAGVLSALLAQEGFHGPPEVLTCEHGFFDAFLGLPGAGHEAADGLGEQYLMRQIAYKRYPVGGPDQTPLYAFLHLITSHELAAEDIEQIEVSVSRSAFHTVMTNQHPSVHLETILALAAVYGEAGAQTILGNCHHQLYYPPRDLATAEQISAVFGTTLALTRSGGRGTRGARESVHETVRPALEPAQALALPENAVVALTLLGGRQYRLIGQRLDPRRTFMHLPQAPALNVASGT